MTIHNPETEPSLLSLDDQFAILLHKKIMNKTGSAKRRAKKYYKDQYLKTGIIPTPLILASQGISEGRKCSGRPRSLSAEIKNRFIVMVRASADLKCDDFIFITQKARTITNYHKWLEEEFDRKISLSALRRCVKEENLRAILDKPDLEADEQVTYCFKSEPVFELVQVDGCVFRYFKIRDEKGSWKKPQVIEFYDTGSRYLFVLDFYFSESSLNAVDLFSRFLLSSSFPEKEIRIRPDNAGGFVNLKRSINALNLKHSLPGRFYLKPDFSRVRSPKDKVHLESSHRSLHHFEIRIIKCFENRIVKKEQGYFFKNGKREVITVTFLDITLQELKDSGVIETYRREHNTMKHYFSDNGKTNAFIPEQKLDAFLKDTNAINFGAEDVVAFEKYGFQRVKATVSTKGTITYQKQTYYVSDGAEHFSRQKSTPVYISHVADKLFIFEYKDDGILLGDALAQVPYEKAATMKTPKISPSELEQIADFLKQQGMVVNKVTLIDKKKKGLTLATAKDIFLSNKKRYKTFLIKLNQPKEKIGIAMFNAFILDCERQQRKVHIAPYASYKEL